MQRYVLIQRFGLNNGEMHSKAETAKICECSDEAIRLKENKAFNRLRLNFGYGKKFVIEEDTEKAFIKKYFEYHDVFADAKPAELGETAKEELQSILDSKKLEVDNVVNIQISKEEEEKRKLKLEDLDLSVRAYNALNRNYGIKSKTVGGIIDLEEKDFRNTRNLGYKTANEVIEKIHSLGLKMKWERDAEEKESTDAELGDSIQQLKTAYSDLKAKDEEYEELKQQLQANTESKKSAEINPNIEKQESESKKQKNDEPYYGEL